MYSIIENGGFQHKAVVGENLKLPLMDLAIGNEVKVPKVLLFSNGTDVKVGQPLVQDAEVTLTVLRHDKTDKVKVFKKMRRKGYRRTRGHRQDYTELLVTSIRCGSDVKTIDAQAVVRAKARIVALELKKVQIRKPTRALKIAANAG